MPYSGLIAGSVFVPYFAVSVIGDPVDGQARVAAISKYAGMVAAFTAPFLGAVIDALGPRKPALGTLMGLMIALTAGLWWVMPDGLIPIAGATAMLAAIKLLYGYTETLHNSMLLRAANGGSPSFLSALSLAIGNISSVACLLFVLFAFVGPASPLFGLDPAEHENVRITGPFVAALMLAATIPILLWTPDRAKSEKRLGPAMREATDTIRGLPRELARNRNASVFLLSRMIYVDGAAALSILLGVFTAGMLKWTPTELLITGVLRACASVFGAMAGAWLDSVVGSKRAIQFALVTLIGLTLVMVGTTPDRIAFFWAYDGQEADRLYFNTLPDVIHLTVAALITGCILLIATSSRALFVQITPAESGGVYFGLYALATTATAWLAPMLIEFATKAFDSQQAGMAPIVVLFVIGLLLLHFVYDPTRRRAEVLGDPEPAPASSPATNDISSG